MIDSEPNFSSTLRDSFPNSSPVEDLIPMFMYENLKSKIIIQNNFKIKNDLKKIILKEKFSKNLNDYLFSLNQLSKKNLYKIQTPTFVIDSGSHVLPVTPQGVEAAYDDYGYALITNPRERRELLDSAAKMTQVIAERGTNAVVFCDRGARPLSVLVDVLWGMFSAEPVPPFFFINTNTKDTYQTDASDVPAERIRQLRAWIASEYPEGSNPFREAQRPVVACVVDEIKGTGRSANFVANLVRRAFPDRAGTVFCQWAEVFHPVWRDNASMIGAVTVPGEFRSTELQSRMAELLRQDLTRLAARYVE